ncbi:MAG: Na(+)-translocating NADH-quinone reductase subunit A [Bacteroidetes bacterium]|nr:Na(+)-translocating NADH-quinone reductase subunit A [Bacteroidota bacterium]MBL6943049.1 Na(+)-translocating NADH-quinone reductase subunit A [Bacteroidales bacterium]
MSTTFVIKNGLDIKLLGEAEKTIVDLNAEKFAIKPPNFLGCFPKVLVKEGDIVVAGTPLFYDKYRDNIVFTASVSGKVEAIKRGAKRRLLEIIIDSDGKNEAIDFGASNINDLKKEDIVEKMLKSGVWPVLRQRPYSIIANPNDAPKAIFVAAYDTSPLAPDFDLIVHGQGDEFQVGLDVLTKLTTGTVHLNVDSTKTTSKVFLNSQHVQINKFSGPHPSGNVSVHINRVDPINKGDIIWYLYPQDVLTIGRLFLKGRFDSTRIIALAGSEVKNPRYYKTFVGASIKNMVSGNTTDGDNRFISGTVLTGEKIEKDGFIGFYDSMVTVIPEGKYHEFFGWLLPGFNKFSFSHTFLSWLRPNKKYRLDTNIHGGMRAYVMTGKFEKVFPFDIYPMQLIKAVLVEDIDLMENLGIYEIDHEDFALCEVIDTSKTEIQSIIRKGLDLMRLEMS